MPEPLEPFLESVDDLSEPLQEAYEKREDGKFYLKVKSTDGWALENVSGLKDALSKEREQASESAKLLKKLGAKTVEKDGGVSWQLPDYDPEEGQKAIQKLKEIGDMKPEEQIREKYEMNLQEAEARHQQAIEKVTGERDELMSQLTENLIETAAIQAIVKHKGDVKLLLPHVKSKMRMVKDDNGRYVHRIVRDSQDGYEITRGQGTDYMQVEEHVALLKKDEVFGRCFEGDGASGTGATGSRKGVPGSGSVDPNLPAWQRVAAERRAAGV